jgi:hypothetical protein
MKKFIRGTLLLVAVVTVQGALAVPPGGANNRQQRIEQIIERLDLTEDQQQQVRPILQSSMEQRRAVLDAHGVGPGKGKPDQQTKSAMHGQMQEIKANTDTQLATILDDDQMQELSEIRKEMKKQLRARHQQYQQQHSAEPKSTQ